jgi:hypothetical protein
VLVRFIVCAAAFDSQATVDAATALGVQAMRAFQDAFAMATSSVVVGSCASPFSQLVALLAAAAAPADTQLRSVTFHPMRYCGAE